MATIFSSVPIPPLLSLFSSSTFPHPLWQSSTDALLLEDSLLALFPSDFDASPSTPLPKDAALVHTATINGSIAHPVVHLQSPNIKTTFLRFPPKNLERELGLPMDWLHFVLKPLGKRELVIELGLKDARGTTGVARASTFTTTAHLSTATLSPTSRSSSPTLLIPLVLPSKSSSTLTPYVTVSLSLSSLLAQFASFASTPGAPSLPSQPRGASWSYFKIYANCRIRRVWASTEQGAEGGGRGREELGVWGTEGEGQD